MLTPQLDPIFSPVKCLEKTVSWCKELSGEIMYVQYSTSVARLWPARWGICLSSWSSKHKADALWSAVWLSWLLLSSSAKWDLAIVRKLCCQKYCTVLWVCTSFLYPVILDDLRSGLYGFRYVENHLLTTGGICLVCRRCEGRPGEEVAWVAVDVTLRLLYSHVWFKGSDTWWCWERVRGTSRTVVAFGFLCALWDTTTSLNGAVCMLSRASCLNLEHSKPYFLQSYKLVKYQKIGMDWTQHSVLDFSLFDGIWFLPNQSEPNTTPAHTSATLICSPISYGSDRKLLSHQCAEWMKKWFHSRALIQANSIAVVVFFFLPASCWAISALCDLWSNYHTAIR